MGVLDGKVVLVTGAGNGIGRECALAAAREGARVVVNDLGSGLSGKDEGSSEPAVAVVEEIRGFGGEAIANFANVADFAAVQDMVIQAIEAFGRVDGVVSPAGILRDGMFHKMTPENWDAVIAVHLRGAFNVSRATIELFREQGGGAYVHFTSTSGLIGNLGQANYAAAKLGIVGLSRSLAMENAGKNVRSNVIAPFAWTRMIASIPVTDEASAQRVERFRATMRADQVALLSTALLADGASGVTGQIFGARGNEVILFNQPRPVASVVRPDGWTPQSLIDQGLPGLSPRFTDLGASATVFAYDAP